MVHVCIYVSISTATTPVDNCPDLTAPTNGVVSFSATTPGSSATYTCNTGYQLVGTSSRTCQSDGTWSDSDPTCTRMYTNKINNCYEIVIVNHCQNYNIKFYEFF